MSGGDALLGAPADTELDRLRAELEEELGRSSLRSVARAVGMSPSGLSKVLAGAQPYRHTLNKLRAWQARRGAGEPSITDKAALETLLRRVPERRRSRVRDEIRIILERGVSGR
jgi:transcriptional regulator with XRE-family HTH domain